MTKTVTWGRLTLMVQWDRTRTPWQAAVNGEAYPATVLGIVLGWAGASVGFRWR